MCSTTIALYIPNIWFSEKKISDNANCFTGNEARYFQGQHNFTMIQTTPYRPHSNGKVEQINRILKGILSRTILDDRIIPVATALARAVYIFDRKISPLGYSPFFLLYSTQPPGEELLCPVYTREATNSEELEWANELVKSHTAPITKSYVNSVKVARAKTREYLQESKALFRKFAPGDWALHIRQGKLKFESYYGGPWAVSTSHKNNTYSLMSPGGYKLVNQLMVQICFKHMCVMFN